MANIKPISQAEMAGHRATLDGQYQADLKAKLKSRLESRYSIADLAVLTGWKQEYFIRLEHEGRIPKARRIGSHQKMQWSEKQARVILGFHRLQNGG